MWPRLRRSRRLSAIIFLIVVLVGTLLIWSRNGEKRVDGKDDLILLRYVHNELN